MPSRASDGLWFYACFVSGFKSLELWGLCVSELLGTSGCTAVMVTFCLEIVQGVLSEVGPLAETSVS